MKVTQNHEEIRKWAEKNGGRPQQINDPDAAGDATGIRIDFPGSRDDYYEPNPAKDEQDISWEQFFSEFDRQGLKMEYDEVINLTDPSLSYRFLKRKPTKEQSPLKLEDIF